MCGHFTDLGKWGWFAAFVYCACAALRLARFNVNTERRGQALLSGFAIAGSCGTGWQDLSG